jgi:hypothetical protein
VLASGECAIDQFWIVLRPAAVRAQIEKAFWPVNGLDFKVRTGVALKVSTFLIADTASTCRAEPLVVIGLDFFLDEELEAMSNAEMLTGMSLILGWLYVLKRRTQDASTAVGLKSMRTILFARYGYLVIFQSGPLANRRLRG